MAGFTRVRSVAAPPEVVFDALADRRGYAAITPLRRVDLEREGDPAVPTVPLLGPVVIRAIRFGVKKILSALSAESERRASSSPNG